MESPTIAGAYILAGVNLGYAGEPWFNLAPYMIAWNLSDIIVSHSLPTVNLIREWLWPYKAHITFEDIYQDW